MSRSKFPASALKSLAIILSVVALFSVLVARNAQLFSKRRILELYTPATISTNEPIFISCTVRSLATHKPLPNIPVTLYCPSIGITHTKLTNAAGQCTLSLDPIENLPQNGLPITLQADDATAQVIIPIAQPPPVADSSILILDKSISRPGDEIRFSAFFRTSDDRPVAEAQALARLIAPDGASVHLLECTSNQWGNISGSLSVAADASPGIYEVRTICGPYSISHKVQVMEYTARRLRIAGEFANGYAVIGRTTELGVQVRRFSGQPVLGATVLIVVRNSEGPSIKVTGKTDSNGQCRLIIPELDNLFVQEQGPPTQLTTMIHVDDGGEPESTEVSLPLHAHDRDVEILPSSGIVFPDTETPFILFAAHPDGSPATGDYEITVNGETTTIAIGRDGWATLALKAGNTHLKASVSRENFKKDFEFKDLQSNFIRIVPTPSTLIVGKTVECRIDVSPAIRDRVDKFEFSVAGTRHVLELDNDLTFSLTAPPRGRELRIDTRIHLKDGGIRFDTCEFPLAVAASNMRLTAQQSELRPGESNQLNLDWNGNGTASVVVVDAAIAARGISPYPEQQVQSAILSRGIRTPFLALPYRESTAIAGNNHWQLVAAVAATRRFVKSAIIAAMVSLFIATLIVKICVILIRSQLLIKVLIVLFILLIFAGMFLPVLSHGRDGTGIVKITEEDAQAARKRNRSAATATATPVRQNFLETLVFLPQVPIIDGNAQVHLQMPDNMTTWHASAVGVNENGDLGAAGTEFIVNKPFFVELECPVAFVKGDRPLLRVTATNNSDAGEAVIHIPSGKGFTVESPRQTANIAAGSTRTFTFPILFTEAGTVDIRLDAKLDQQSDSLLQKVTVTENGRKFSRFISDTLAAGSAVTHGTTIPPQTIESHAVLRVQSKPLTQVISGLEGMLREPHGCFEQITSVNYPNIMILSYLKRHNQSDNGLERQTLERLRSGYKRLLSYEVKDGGFSLYGRAPASVWLSALALRQFHEMEEHLAGNPAIRERTWDWLQGRIASTHDRQLQAYAVWAVADAGLPVDNKLRDQMTALAEHSSQETYTQALGLNAAISLTNTPRKYKALAEGLARQVLSAKQTSHGRTLSTASGIGARVELYALAAIALMRSQGSDTLLNDLRSAIIRMRRGDAWPGTQATALALQALMDDPQSAADGVLTVTQGEMVKHLAFKRLDLTSTPTLITLPKTDAPVELAFSGSGRVTYSLTTFGTQRWSATEHSLHKSGLELKVEYPPHAQTGTESVITAIIVSLGNDVHNGMVDLSLGPAFRPDMSKLRQLQKHGAIEGAEEQPGRLILYLGRLAQDVNRRLEIPVVPVLAGTFTLPASKAYEYYAPENICLSEPTGITVHASE